MFKTEKNMKCHDVIPESSKIERMKKKPWYGKEGLTRRINLVCTENHVIEICPMLME